MTYLLDTNAISDLMRASPRIENWMARLDPADRIVICTIVRGEILFGISRLPEGRRGTELEQAGHQFLAAFRCEPVPEEAGDLYAVTKLARRQRGLALDENDLWVAATATLIIAGQPSLEVLLDGEMRFPSKWVPASNFRLGPGPPGATPNRAAVLQFGPGTRWESPVAWWKSLQ